MYKFKSESKSVIAGCIAVLMSSSLYAQEFLPKWESGYLDIHTIASSQGESQFVIFPDGTTMLIDAGDTGFPFGDNIEWAPMIPNAARSVGEIYESYIKHFMEGLPGGQKLDYVFITHFHGDHMKALPHICKNFEIGTYVDRDYPDYSFPSRKHVERNCGKVLLEVLELLERQKREYGCSAESFKVGSKSQFIPQHEKKQYKNDFFVRNICGEGYVWTGKGEKSKKIYTCSDEKLDENMLSCGVVIKYGDFAYSNLGDLSGGSYDIYASGDRAFESYVAKVIGKVTLHKPSHHGWKDSSCAEFLLAARPEIFVFPSANKDHPYKKTFERISDPLVYRADREYYITTDFVKDFIGAENWKKFKPCGHIVCRVYPNGNSYRMYVLDAYSGDYRIVYQSNLKKLSISNDHVEKNK